MNDDLETERWVSQVLAADLIAEQKAHAKTVLGLRVALVVLILNAILLIVFAVKYLHAVDMPQTRCLHPARMDTMRL
jgi:hypothetical protein